MPATTPKERVGMKSASSGRPWMLPPSMMTYDDRSE
ncbi:hypothetical protein STIAU_2247, partial [Stigmatella aurantiaca DW4/3-1]